MNARAEGARWRKMPRRSCRLRSRRNRDFVAVLFQSPGEEIHGGTAEEASHKKIDRSLLGSAELRFCCTTPSFMTTIRVAHGHRLDLVVRDINHRGLQSLMLLRDSVRIWTRILASRLESGSSKRKTFG